MNKFSALSHKFDRNPSFSLKKSPNGRRFDCWSHSEMQVRVESPIFKRPGHRNYIRNAKELEIIWTDVFPNWTEQSAKMIHEKMGIPMSTIYNWLKRWRNDPNWRPTDTQARGIHHRIFTDDEEAAISAYILDSYIVPGRMFTNLDFQALIIQAFMEKYRDCENPPEFTASEGFIQDFKARNGFSTRRAHAKRRPERRPELEQQFCERISELLRTVDRDRIVNCDETFWRCYPSDLRTWGKEAQVTSMLTLTAMRKTVSRLSQR